jgi:hypothetical protein
MVVKHNINRAKTFPFAPSSVLQDPDPDSHYGPPDPVSQYEPELEHIRAKSMRIHANPDPKHWSYRYQCFVQEKLSAKSLPTLSGVKTLPMLPTFVQLSEEIGASVKTSVRDP